MDGLLHQVRAHGRDLSGVVQHQQTIRGQVVQEGAVTQEGPVEADVGRCLTLSQVVQVPGERLLGRGGAVREVQPTEAREHTPIQGGQEFVGRGDLDLLDRIEGPLGGRVEAADGVYVVAKQLDAIGHRAADREYVQDAAPAAEAAGYLHHGSGLVAKLHPASQGGLEWDPLPQLQPHRGTSKLLRGHQQLHHRASAGNDHRGGSECSLSHRSGRGSG